jgi:low temperature requirement protein LtrA
LALNSLLFLVVAGVFGGIFGAFHAVDQNLTGVLIGVYVTLLVEWIGTMAISMSWRKLSFTATHISERLGLLGLIIIGEGVIGTTKTIARTMGKNGPTVGSSAQIFCIVLLLVRSVKDAINE